MDTTSCFLDFMAYYIKTSLNVIKSATLTARKYRRTIKLAKYNNKGVLNIPCSLSRDNTHRTLKDYKIKRNLNQFKIQTTFSPAYQGLEGH